MKIEGYTFFGRAREGKKGGGVAIFVKDELKSRVAPHYSHRNLEIVWVSIERQGSRPLFFGTYYGKQEGVKVDEITEEMDNLAEEIKEVKAEGELILCMDANAKIGLLGEEMSRNGKLMEMVMEECELIVMNKENVCKGVVTRQNRKRTEEKSAIDFIVASYGASQCFNSMLIDESGDLRIRNVNDSDHNTIVAGISLNEVPKAPIKCVTDWNFRAPPECWQSFRNELRRMTNQAHDIMENRITCITSRYQKWEQLLYKAAIKTIGRTTWKSDKKKCPRSVQLLREQKKKLKREFEAETDQHKKGVKLQQYLHKQKELYEKAEEEEENEVKNKFAKMVNEANNGGFWKERRALNRDEGATWGVMKGEDGKRIFNDDQNKENIASYYEKLYRDSPFPYHPYHDTVAEQIDGLTKSRDPEPASMFDCVPSYAEVKSVIEKKKDRKATTDWKNVILKKGGDEMVNFIMPVIKAVWQEEAVPEQWNMGIITNIWKGKGDRERLENQRGITVSSSIGTIMEELINRRLLCLINFSQAQAGGKKGASTTDHVFILRNIMAAAKKEGKHLIISFFDVKKAYDRADMNDMLYILHKHGLKGKTWRLTRALNVGLTAKVKTKTGLTRTIKREKGGKQGGKLMVPMFAKAMDEIMEDFENNSSAGIDVDGQNIPALLFMDDVMTLTEGYDKQATALRTVNEFGWKHKIEWGHDKCKVMEVGTHKEKKKEWELGDMKIGTCQSYKYLGEIIQRDGKNEENLKERFKKVKQAVQGINTCGKARIMKRIEIKALLTLHESVTIPTLLYNSETWPLNSATKKEIDKMELWALKSMFGLPKTTPTPAIIHETGVFYASIRVQEKQLLYLQKVLKKEDTHWTRLTLDKLKRLDTGWATQINGILREWNLETDWQKIQERSHNAWKQEVRLAAEKANKSQLLNDCYKTQRGSRTEKSKTKHLIQLLETPTFARQPAEFMKENNKLIARAYIMGKFRMLHCAANFSDGHGGKMCQECNVIDDEDHRINSCAKWADINLYNALNKLDFECIHSSDISESIEVVKVILNMWDLENGKNCMRVS